MSYVGESTARRRRAGAALAAAIVAATLVTAPTAAFAAPADDLAPVMLVLDASGSMRDSVAGGDTKMTAAKTAVRTLLAGTPDGARLGLAVYGTGTGNTAADKAAGCQDVTVARPVAPLDRAALTAAVDGVQPRGYTPIGHSLRVAAEQLPADGPRSIVLVSDGVDTCTPPDPCEVAKELAAKGVDLRIHAVGFAVDNRARAQLSCVTGATGGTYVDAADTAALTGALHRITRRALRAYDTVGTPVTGTRAPAGAPALRPGAYLDHIGPDEERYYTVDVPPGWTLYATASAVLAGGGDYLVYVSRYDSGRSADCSGRAGAVKTEGPVGSAALRWTAPPGGDDPCARPGAQLIRVTLDAVSVGDPASELELLIGLEPPAQGDTGPPGNADPATFTEPRGAARPVTGGGSFNTAAVLDGSGAYSDAVASDEMAFYRLRLNWGQGLAYRLRVPAHADINSVFVKTAWYNPARDQRDTDSTAYSGKEVLVPSDGALAGPPVRYRNRELPNTEAGAGAGVAGWYYISVWADAPSSKTPLPVVIELAVTGDTRPGPAYTGDGSNPFGDAGDTGRAARASDPDPENASFAEPLLWIGIPLTLLLLAGTVLVLILRRRYR